MKVETMRMKKATCKVMEALTTYKEIGGAINAY